MACFRVHWTNLHARALPRLRERVVTLSTPVTLATANTALMERSKCVVQAFRCRSCMIYFCILMFSLSIV